MSRSKETCARMLSLTGHELRTPTSIVTGYLRMLLQELAGPLSERQRKLVEESLKSCTRLTSLAGEISELAQLEAGMVTLSRQPVALFPLVASATREMPPLPDTDVQIELSGDEDGATVRGDGGRLRAAFVALMTACAREIGFKSALTVHRSVRVDQGERVALVVVGAPGATSALAREDLRRLEPFDQWRGGLGLSLVIGVRVIEGHGGRLFASRADEHKGAVLVTLPIEN